jgi:mRNA-degrading endonuclease RelE of RelBE toxin-antitoxin system|tara:strand:- start:1386 stop:1637 length:252 start_codon:yes stop_codon:yes gene_type:complete
MTYKIQSSKEFESDFRKIDSSLQKRIKKKFLEVAKDPERYKRLHPPLQKYCRIWIEKLRILFSYSIEKNILYLEKIVFGHRYP